ncbi:hypothetical protein G4D82_08975 [Flavobacterium sp. CYK-4]|uniref:hypothetical protein n=1 Tax=Flavobacterium lotistagni TaxID=2709660 RepID=UPI00140BC567|nr:hypothetical protein [Flavobacterium lotistagni]NHM07351.1 hypothetical protein [Flavobacterium lotistagni]
MRNALLASLLLFAFISCTEDRDIPAAEIIKVNPESQLIYYWNFNNLSGTTTRIIPDYSLVATTASITYDGTGPGYMDGDTGGYLLNARNNDLGENLLKVRNPSHTRSLLLSLPTNGFQKVILQFALSRSNNGATTQNYTYTIDGLHYTNVGLNKIAHNPAADPTVDLVAIDFSNIPEVSNNPDFKFKIDFSGDAAAGASGNNRFDNITLEGLASQ